MVARTLVEHDIEVGRALVEELDRQQVPVRAVMWYYLSDQGEFRLLVSTPIVDKEGPIAAYDKMFKVAEQIPARLQPGPFDIAVISTTDERIKELRKAIKTGKNISNIRLTRNVIGDLYVEDALVYRLN